MDSSKLFLDISDIFWNLLRTVNNMFGFLITIFKKIKEDLKFLDTFEPILGYQNYPAKKSHANEGVPSKNMFSY